MKVIIMTKRVMMQTGHLHPFQHLKRFHRCLPGLPNGDFCATHFYASF